MRAMVVELRPVCREISKYGTSAANKRTVRQRPLNSWISGAVKRSRKNRRASSELRKAKIARHKASAIGVFSARRAAAVFNREKFFLIVLFIIFIALFLIF